MYKSYNNLVICIPKYFHLLDAIINGIALLISLSDYSLLVYRNTTDFSYVYFLSCILVNLFIGSNYFLFPAITVSSSGCSIYMIMLCVNKNSFTFSFSTWMPFISFSCLIALARTSHTTLNRSDEMRADILVLFLNLKEKYLIFHH